MDTRRFHTPQYKRQIQSARAYRRAALPEPENGFRKFLARIGLGTVLRQAAFVLVLAAVMYLMYYAQFMKIAEPAVSGTITAQAVNDVRSAFRAYVSQYVFGLPQRNILFFSGSRFSQYLLAHNVQISGVQVARKPWRRLEITVTERIPAFTLSTQGRFFVLNSDGSLGPQAQQPDKKLPLLKDSADEQVLPGQAVFDRRKMAFMIFMTQNFTHQLPGETIDHYEFAGLYSSDLVVVASVGTKFYFDSAADPQLTIRRLLTLWQSLTPQQQQQLAYVDMRFDPKAYGCYKNDACAEAAPAQPAPGSLNPAVNAGQAQAPAPKTGSTKK